MSHSHRTYRTGLATRMVLMPWPCRDPDTASLHPVPPGQSRRGLFCSQCTASVCLFGGTPSARRMRQAERRWAMPDEGTLELYLAGLRLYTGLLRAGRTCWRCAHLCALKGRQSQYVCLLASDMAEVDDSSSLEGPAVMSSLQAQLRTSLEGCGDAFFEERRRRVPQLEASEWRRLVRAGKTQGCCAWCAHLRRVFVGENERFVCSLQTRGLPEHLVWRAARSWKVMRTRNNGSTWCHGRRWELRTETMGA